MSPVTRTSASTPAQRSFNAVTGDIVNTSRLGDDGGELSSLFGNTTTSPASWDGLGVRGGSGTLSVEPWCVARAGLDCPSLLEPSLWLGELIATVVCDRTVTLKGDRPG